jgi:hypothetical protein
VPDNKYKVITEELTHKYKALKRGEKPGRGKQRDFAAVTAVGLSMYAVFHGPPHQKWGKKTPQVPKVPKGWKPGCWKGDPTSSDDEAFVSSSSRKKMW